MSGDSPPVHKSRAPAINPFDKLNQKQFDSYVSSIQAKIKVALDPPSPEPQHVSRTFAEISRSTIASPSLSPAPLSKRPIQDTHNSSRATYTPLGAGTPDEPYELSDDDDNDENMEEVQFPRSRSQSEMPYEEDQEPLGSIQEENEQDGVESEGEQQSPNGSLYGQQPNEGAWDYSGEDASEQDELSEDDEFDENEEEDVFVGKGKGRHPAEGPGLAGLLNSSSAHRASVAPGSSEQMSDSISPDNSFEAGVAQMPTLGTTSTPFVSRFATRRSARNMEEINDNEDDGSPPWEGDQSALIPMGGRAYEGDNDEGVFEEPGAGTGHDTAIEVLDSDEDNPSDRESNMEVDRPVARLSGSIIPGGLYAGLDGVAYPEFDDSQFNNSAAFLHRTFEPDSLLDDTMDDYGSVPPGNVLHKPSSLFTGSSANRTREPSESGDAEESADTAHAHNCTAEGPETGARTPSVRGEESEFDQRSIQQSMDYSDFIGEKSLLANQLDNSLTRTQVEENFLEVTVYELENGSRFYDHDGIRHFLNPEGEVYETCPIPPPRPTIQRPPDLSMIEEVTEYDMTRRMIGQDAYDEDQGQGRFDFLKGLDDTLSSGAPISGYHPEDNANNTFDMEDIPQRPGGAMGFRARIVRGADGSAFLSESLVLEDSINESLPTERAAPLSRNHSLEQSMTGRNAGDLISEADDLISDDTFANADDDSIDSILDDDDSRDRSDISALANREDLTTPVPHKLNQVVGNQITNEGMDMSGVQDLPELDEKSVADALAAVAQFAQASSLEGMGMVGELPETDVSMFANSEYHAFNQGTEGLENLIDATSMTSAEEDILAHSFGAVDALQNTTGPAGETDEVLETAAPGVHNTRQTIVQSSVLAELVQPSHIDLPISPEKLASEVLAEVFEGVDPVALPSGTFTGAATPLEISFLEPEPIARIEEIDIDERSHSSATKPSDDAAMEVQESSLRRTPPTPTLSAGQSPTAHDMSVATSISGLQPYVSIYEGSPASSSHQDDMNNAVSPESDGAQLPDPTLPPAPTHLATPIVSGDVSESSEAHRELSPSIVVEPPTPYTRSEVDAEQGTQDVKLEDGTKTTANEMENSVPIEPVQDSDPEDAASVDELLSDGENTATDRSRGAGESGTEISGRGNSEPRATPTPEKRRMVFDGVELPLPRRSPQSSHTTPSRFMSDSIVSPVSDAAPPGYSPTPRKYQSLYKQTPKSVPFRTASESGALAP
ncbi:hypothetical protein BN14_06039 [Rhizoctonia solani AG-1 IB]|uniref:Uncharacterized protein n=1 Tax=Thanatephorus cucumeris (strain AG1-IB / isolate 7/3/14) TaxID=1108050 RepID=M5C816_THACB|nr:hypothetical protein BN14_06039 [Rhizoctonia solani AG-1 IB]